MLLDHLAEAWVLIFSWQTILFVVIGTILGSIIGAIPGLTCTMAMAIFVPFTFFMDPMQGIPFLLGLYKGGTYGGSISAILIGTPGTSSNAATVVDGYPMAQQGLAGRALKAALYSSLVGDLVGTCVLFVAAPQLARIALGFSPADFTGLIFFSLVAVASISGGSLLKAWLATLIGFFFVMVGPDLWTGTPRFAFGYFELGGGFSIVPLTIGLFAFSQMLIEVEKGGKKLLAEQKALADLNLGGGKFGALEVFKHFRLVTQSALQGIFLGVLPGLGAPVACWTAYAAARWRAKEPGKFGKGAIEGVIAPETANNAVPGAAMIPMLVFGIPGDVVTAVLMGGFIAQGLRPSPLLFQQDPSILYALFIGMYFATVALWLTGMALVPMFVKILKTKKTLLYPIVLMFCLVGSYAVQNSLVDVGGMVLFGILGYLARKHGYPLPPVAIGFVLGKILEENFRLSIVMSRGSPMIFLTEPISAVFLALSVLLIIGSFVWKYRQKTQVQLQVPRLD